MAFVETVFRVTDPRRSRDDPDAVFTQAELGAVGLTEEEARAQKPIAVNATSFRPMRTALPGRRTGC